MQSVEARDQRTLMASSASSAPPAVAAKPKRPARPPRSPRPGAPTASTPADAELTTRPTTKPTAKAAPQSAVAEADFLDLAGHELRAPMTILKGQAQLLQRRLRREGGREADLADLDRMLYQMERLNHQIGSLLDATHLAQHRLTLAPVEFDLAPSVQRLVALCDAGSTGGAIHYDAPTGPFVGRWDRQRIESVIRELLFNALKFGGDEIEVRLTREAGQGRLGKQGEQGAQARIEVEDHGIGVPAGERRAIFAERAQGSNAEHAGVGLGLYVAREIVRRHHGRIGVRPRAPKGAKGINGSVFWVTLPLLPTA